VFGRMAVWASDRFDGVPAGMMRRNGDDECVAREGPTGLALPLRDAAGRRLA
jgi:hypothetical protein